MARTKKRNRVFISYSHRDAKWLEMLKPHLTPLERDYGIDIWSDRDIPPGARWREEITTAVESAKVAVLLVSANFFASQFIASNELPPLLTAAREEGALILAIHLSHTSLSEAHELSEYQSVNPPSEPVRGMTVLKRDEVFAKVAREIMNALGDAGARARKGGAGKSARGAAAGRARPAADDRQVARLKDSVRRLTEELRDVTERYRRLREQVETTRPEPLPSGVAATFYLGDSGDRRVVILTGNIRDVLEDVARADVVVSSENTDMQLARFYDASVSGTLRHMDAEKGPDGRVTKDWLSEKLGEEIRRLGVNLPVTPGVVFATPTTKLAEKGVKYIFHVAAVEGDVEAGYRPVPEKIGECVRNCCNLFAKTAAQAGGLNSILFPLIGAGTARLSPQQSAEKMLHQITKSMTMISALTTTYLIARVDSHLRALKEAAGRLQLRGD